MTSKNTKQKRSTDVLINDSIAQQQNWRERRRSFARRFFKSLNVFAKPSAKTVGRPAVTSDKNGNKNKKHSVLREYWFPILCAFIVIFVVIWVLFNRIHANRTYTVTPVPEPVVRTVSKELKTPMFDIVRIGDNGSIVIAGRWHANTRLSVFMNKKLGL